MRIYISRAVDLYLSEFLDIFDSSGHPTIVGYVLATIESIQMLSYMSNMPDYTIKDPFINTFISRILNGFKIYGIVGDSFDIRIIFTIIITVIDFLIIGNVVVLLIYMQSSKATLIKPISITTRVQQNIFESTWFKYLKIIISFHSQTYYEILRIPILFCSLSCMKDIIMGDMNSNLFNSYIILFCIVSTIISLIISLFIIFHSTEYRFKKYNILGKSASRQIIISFLLDISLLFVSATTYQSLTISFGIVHNIILLYYHIKEKIYIHSNLSIYLTNIYLAQLIYQSNLIFNYFDIINYNALYFIWFAYPVIYRITQHYSVNNFEVFKRKSEQQQIRYLYFIFKTLIQSKRNLINPSPQKVLFIYCYITNHIQFCKMKRDRMILKSITIKSTCFCDDFLLQYQQIHFENLAQIQLLYKGLITQYLEDQSLMQFSLNNTANFHYLYSLIQIKKTPTQALYEILRIKRLKKKEFSLTNQFSMRRILKFSLIEFEKLIKKNDLRNQNLHFSDVYKYEESIYQIKLNIIDSVRIQTKNNCQKLDKLLFSQQVKQKSNYNRYFIQILTLRNAILYITYFRSSQILISRRDKIHTRDGRRYQQFQQTIDKQIHDRDNCVIQITLLQPRGTIIKSTRMFAKYLGYRDEEIIDQNIKKFMPSIIAADHDLYLNNFVERGRINIVKKDKRLILAKHKSGFLIPINVRLKLEVGIDEFGSSALISPWSENFAYVLLNQKGGLEEINQSIQQFKGIDFLFFVPDIANQWSTLFEGDVESLDKKFDLLLYIPQVQIKAQNSNTPHKSTRRFIQNQIINSITSYSEKITVYAAQIRVFSLLTINLKLIILEFQAVKLNHTQKISPQIMKQLQARTQNLQSTMSNSFHSITQKETNIPARLEKQDNPSIFLKHQVQHNKIQNIQQDEYDLEELMIYEDDQMIDDQKLRFQSVNLTNSNQQQLNSAPFREDLIQELESEKLLLKYKGEEITHTVSRMKRSGHYRQPINVNQAESIGKQSSGNQSYVKRYLKETILQQGQQSRSYQIYLLMFLLIVFGMNILDFSLIFIDIRSVENKQQIGSLPFKIAYFYYEFITSTLLYDMIYFDFQTLRNISFDFIQNNAYHIDEVSQYMSYMDETDPTFKQEVINIINYMSLIKDSDLSIEYETHMEFKEYLDLSADKIFENNPTDQTIDFRYFLIIELALILGCLGYFLYILFIISRNRTRVYKIFTTFDSKVIQELLNVFNSLQTQINNNRFKKNDTDEENFENTMIRQLQKSQTVIFIKGIKVGRQILNRKNNQQILIDTGILSFILLGFTFYVCFIFTYYQLITQQIKNEYTQKITFLEAYIDIADAFCQRQIIQSEFDESLQSLYVNNLKDIDENLDFINQKLQKYQQNDNQLIYNIFAIDFCSNIKYLPNDPITYSNLFNQSQCEQQSDLTKGLTVSTQYIYSEHLQLYQQLQTNRTTKQFLIQNFTNQNLQLIRLYESYGILQIANYLGYKISSEIDQFILNILALLFISFIINIIAYVSLLYILNKSIDEFQQSKQLLSLIPFQKLLENAYLVSFIQSEIRK
ncbi:hypothetical protein pb186bvf_016972 [Paramecium bursaria]